jgi:hypothetical protein
MDKAEAQASLLKAQDSVFTNLDLFLKIKSHIGCETITNWCLTNKDWCDKVYDNNQLRIEVARCVMTCINKNLKALREMLQNEIARNGEWINDPVSPLFIEFGDTYFAAGIQLHEQSATTFLEENPTFKPTVRNTGKLLALLFNVSINSENMNTDIQDPQYSNLIIGFNQRIPRAIRLKLPFSRVVVHHDDQISLSPVDNLNVNEFPFDEILNWPHLRRGLRRRSLTVRNRSL